MFTVPGSKFGVQVQGSKFSGLKFARFLGDDPIIQQKAGCPEPWLPHNAFVERLSLLYNGTDSHRSPFSALMDVSWTGYIAW
jgi:hypothetical protein